MRTAARACERLGPGAGCLDRRRFPRPAGRRTWRDATHTVTVAQAWAGGRLGSGRRRERGWLEARAWLGRRAARADFTGVGGRKMSAPPLPAVRPARPLTVWLGWVGVSALGDVVAR